MKYLLLALLSFPVYSATSGTLLLHGVVPKKVEVTISPESVSNALDLETTQVDLKVATITSKSNVIAGYKIGLSSSNNLKLVHETNSSKFINYTVKINTTPLANNGNINYTNMGTTNRDVTVSYTGIDFTTYDDGNYSDTLTFTITSN